MDHSPPSTIPFHTGAHDEPYLSVPTCTTGYPEDLSDRRQGGLPLISVRIRWSGWFDHSDWFVMICLCNGSWCFIMATAWQWLMIRSSGHKYAWCARGLFCMAMCKHFVRDAYSLCILLCVHMHMAACTQTHMYMHTYPSIHVNACCTCVRIHMKCTWHVFICLSMCICQCKYVYSVEWITYACILLIHQQTKL